MPADYSLLPAVSRLLSLPELAGVPHSVAVRAARAVLDECRAMIRAGGSVPDDIGARVIGRAAEMRAPSLRRVVNATGVVLHTNLGRAPLAPFAAARVADVAAGYSNTELLLETGARGGRLDGVAGPLCTLTGAGAAIGVNNNAAAVLLALTALAHGRDVVVSRGELVEIGGSFRVPDVISAGGARLVEVGTTNRTRVDDYARAIGPNTAVLLRVHPSNFRIQGFTERPDRAGLAALARDRGVLMIEDLGSGLLGTPPRPEMSDLDAVERALSDGADLVCASGDKLLGGPQAGLLLGRADVVAQLRRHPMYRALRLDKLVLAALEGTLQMYLDDRADEIPTRALLARSAEDCRVFAETLVAALPGARLVRDVAYTGGGALPAQPLDGWVAELVVGDPDALARALRLGQPAVVARVARGALVLDPRSLLPGEVPLLVGSVRAALAAGAGRR